jgi:hypothetical protein
VIAYSTSPAALDAAREQGLWLDGQAVSEDRLGPESVFTITTQPSGATFRLLALHIMTKDLGQWLWITLWWSPDPDSDFGADRPASLPAPWSQYKMCVVSDFTDATEDGLSSCSNPYFERGRGNTRTNCIGCHQHAGRATDERLAASGRPLTIEDSFFDEPVPPDADDATARRIEADNRQRRERYPEHGRTRLGDLVPGDYVFSLVRGAAIAPNIASEWSERFGQP